MTKEQELILELWDILAISDKGYHKRGAAHEAFIAMNESMDVVNAAWWSQDADGKEGTGR